MWDLLKYCVYGRGGGADERWIVEQELGELGDRSICLMEEI